MKREPKAWVKCLKELTEFGLRPSNHLIATGPKLDTNTLHIKAKYFAHQSLVFGMDGHPLVKLAYVLYGISSTIVHSESKLMESLRKLSPFYLACEG